MGGSYTAVLDRIVDGDIAVLLLEEAGEVVDEVATPVDDLPTAGRHEGAVFDVDVESGSLLEACYRERDERERRERVEDRFDRLSERLPDE